MDNLISNILKGKKFSYISIPFWEYEKCRKQVHNLLIGCIYPYRIEYQLMRLANALSHKHKNEQDVEEETCPLRKCLYEFDSIERCKSRCISFQDEDFKNNMFKNIEKREIDCKNKYNKLRANLVFIMYKSNANFIEVLKELNTRDIDFDALRNNRDFIILRGYFEYHKSKLHYIHNNTIGMNEMYSKNSMDYYLNKHIKDIWPMWYNSSFATLNKIIL